MFYNLFTELRAAKLPVTLKEYLVLLEGLEKTFPITPSMTSTTWRARPW